MIRYRLLALSVVLALVGACGDDDGDDDDDDDDDDETCLPDCAFDAHAYELRARFDWETNRLIASEDITVVVSPASSSIELDADVEVSRVHAGETELVFEVDAAAGTLRVELAPLAPGDAPVTFTVEYEAAAAPASALIAALPRDNDPVDARVVFTNSEPDRGSQWLVAKHDPSDRARWAVELTVADGEDAVSNGDRAADDETAAGRVVRYELDTPIPTYLMAFAAGEVTHTERADGRVPLSVWHRAGLLVDAEAHLDIVAEQIATFEALIGPYPWDSYAVVLVPELGGGMENATITFNNELTGQGNISFALNAHELAHQWFGDWVTMRTYDDVWVKEGMATLLAAEADRARRDEAGLGRLMGYDLAFSAGDAIVDRDLTGLDKYTSGPYERAAWTITQIRARLGEAAFWASLREVLAAHARSSITGELFLRHFAPELDEATITQLLGALEERDVAQLDFTVAPTGAGNEVTMTLSDPGATFLDPIDISVVDAAGATSTEALAAGEALTVTVPSGGYLAPDEGDVHPTFDWTFYISENFYDEVRPLYLPPAAPATLAAFGDGSATHQERVLYAGLPVYDPEAFTALHAALDSDAARFSAMVQGCYVLLGLAPEDTGPWIEALTPIFDQPASTRFSNSYGYCGALLGTQLFATELADLGTAIAADRAARLEYLLSFDYGSETLALVGVVATDAPSLKLRDLAIARLSFQTVFGYGYSAIPAEELDAWRTFFRGRLPETTSSGRFRVLWRGVVGLADLEALPLVAPLFHTVPLAAYLQYQTLCQAYEMTIDAPDAWIAFVTALGTTDDLSAEANQVLADPAATCGFSAARMARPAGDKGAAEMRQSELHEFNTRISE
jgi:aminopeptidase N